MCALNIWGVVRQWRVRVEAVIVEFCPKDLSHLKEYLSWVRVQFAVLVRFEKSGGR